MKKNRNEEVVAYMTYIFTDFYRNNVQLSFEKEPFSKIPKHVWVISRYQDRWLLTHHRTRGLEFPGGKVEPGETAEEAAIREVMEETGGVVEQLHYIAQYNVDGKSDKVIKNVYFANIESLEVQDTYYETLGPKLLQAIPENVKENNAYSFMMKDEVLVYCLTYVRSHFMQST